MKHKAFGCVILFLSARLAFATFSSALDETLQKFREKILDFQLFSLITLDENFFKFYDLLYGKINASIIHRQLLLKEDFNVSCTKFPMYNLEPNEARRFFKICDDIQLTVPRILRKCNEILEKYYPPLETFDTETVFELLAKDYFESSKKHLELVVQTYNQNSTCVTPFLESFLRIFKKPIDTMLKLNQRLINMVNKGVKRDLRFITLNGDKLFYVTSQMIQCSNDSIIDTTGCLGEFLNYDCFKRKSGCGIFYKSIYIIRDHLRNIDEYYQFYDDGFYSIFTSFKRTDELLVEWADSVNDCVVT